MHHFIYKTISPTGKYYIGRHSTNTIEDGYCGSGKWVRSIKDKSKLNRVVLEFCEESDLFERENFHINENIGKENCMNFNNNPIGFASGKLNPACSEIGRKRTSFRVSGDKNPAKRKDVRMKMSESQKNRPRKSYKMSDEGRKNISAGRTGLKISDEGRSKLAESRKKQYENGERVPPTFKGRTHSQETIAKMKLAAMKRWKTKELNTSHNS